MNRLHASLAAATHQQKRFESDERKARTRTLIQAGSLLQLAGLIDAFDITLGEDLQLDDTAKENAAALLGFLIETAERISDNEDSMDMQKWHKAGVRALTRAAYKKIKG